MKDRINFIRQHEGLTLAQLASLLDATPSAMAHICSGRNKPSFEILSAIARNLPQYDLRWLLTGAGTPLATHDQECGELCDAAPASPAHTAPTEPELFDADTYEQPHEMRPLTTPDSQETEQVECDNRATAGPQLTSAITANQTDRLIICFLDHTFAEYTRRR